MSKKNDESLKRMNPTGIKMKDMTEEQKLALRQEWNAVVSVRENLECTCPSTFCRMNHNCRSCIALNRYYGNFSDCLRPLVDEMQAHLPQPEKYNMHAKMQASGRAEGLVDPTIDPDIMREILHKNDPPGLMLKRFDMWDDVVNNPKNTACKCSNTDCWFHNNCTKCIALHRNYGGFPACYRDIVDEVEAIVEEYKRSAEND